MKYLIIKKSDADEYSIWPAENKPIPSGWEVSGETKGKKEEEVKKKLSALLKEKEGAQ
jgi:uncharacterized protein YbdZ (MbtH family)